MFDKLLSFLIKQEGHHFYISINDILFIHVRATGFNTFFIASNPLAGVVP